MSIQADGALAQAFSGASSSTWTAGAVFRDDHLARLAAAELQEAGFEGWQIEISRHGSRSECRALMTIAAGDRHHEAAAILRRCGASRLALIGPDGLALG